MAYRDEALQFEKHFERAQGWLALGKIDESALALEQIPDSYRLHTPVVAFRCELHLAAKRWDVAAMLAKRLAEIEPAEPEHWIRWAYATRRQFSISRAEGILRRAQILHPDCAVIPFNLACYAAQEGRFNAVPELLKSAIRLDPSLQRAARLDEDLEPYWRRRGFDGMASQ